MTKRFFILFFLFSILCISNIHAQFLDLTIPSGELPSDVATWQDKADLLHLSFAIPEGIELENAHIVFEVTEGSEHILVSTRTKFRDQPSLKGSFKKKNFVFNDLVNTEAIDVDPSVKSVSSAVGKLPAGFFGICFYLIDSAGKPITAIYQGCTNFFVRDIDSPVLLSPQNETAISENTPLTFIWTPAHVISQTAHYQFKIYPMYPGQTPDQAMASSTAIYKSDDIFSTTFLYPPDAPKLSEIKGAKGFAWIVTQLNQDGKTIGKNYGRSISSVFYMSTDGKNGK